MVPSDFPHPVRWGNAQLFKALHGGVPRSTWAKWKATGKIPPPDKQVGALPYWREVTMWRTLNGAPSTNIISFRDQNVIVVLAPRAPELADNERMAIAAATGHVRFFLCSWSERPLSEDAVSPIQHFPVNSIIWAMRQATLIAPQVLNNYTCPCSSAELVANLLAMDAEAGNDDHRVTFTLVSTQPLEIGEIVALHRDHAPFAQMPELPKAPAKRARETERV